MMRKFLRRILKMRGSRPRLATARLRDKNDTASEVAGRRVSNV